MVKLTRPMIEALYVARVADHVSTGVTWVGRDGCVKTGTICALIDRDLIMRNPRGAWELTRKGIFQLAVEKTISFEEAERMQIALNKRVDQAHAEALDLERDRAANESAAEVFAEIAAENEQCRIVTTERDDLIERGRALGFGDLRLNADTESLREMVLGAEAERDESVVPRSCGRPFFVPRWKTVNGVFVCDVRVSQGQFTASGSSNHPAHEGPCYDAMRRVWSHEAANYPDPVKLGGGLIAEAPDVRSEFIKELTKIVIADGTKLIGIRDALSDLADRWQGSSNLTRRLDGLELERVLQEFK